MPQLEEMTSPAMGSKGGTMMTTTAAAMVMMMVTLLLSKKSSSRRNRREFLNPNGKLLNRTRIKVRETALIPQYQAAIRKISKRQCIRTSRSAVVLLQRNVIDLTVDIEHCAI